MGLRERFSATYATEDPNRFRTELASGPIHYREGEGWQRIERNLRPVPGKRFDNGGRNDFVLSVAGDHQDRQLARLETKAGEMVAFSLEGARPGAASPDPASGAQQLTYRSILPHVDVQLTSLATSLKEVLVLSSAKAPTRYVFPLTLRGVTAEVSQSGEVLYRDGGGEVVFRTPRPWMTDSAAGADRPGATSTDVAFRVIEQPGGGTALELTVSPEWLNDPARVFPVKVDPTVISSSKNGTPYFYVDTFYGEYNKTVAFTGDSYLYAGVYHLDPYYKHRSFLQFGLGAKITPGDGKHTVTKATFSAYQIKASNCQRAVYAKRVTQSWSGSPDAFASQFGPTYDASDTASPAAGTTCPANGQGWLTFDVTGTAKNWEDNDAIDNFGIALLASLNSSDTERGFVSQNHTSSTYHPKLVVEWWNNAPVPDSPLPSSGAVVTTAPTLSAVYKDGDGDWGGLYFEMQRRNDNGTWGSSVFGRGSYNLSTNYALQPNETGYWKPSTSPGVYQWRVRAEDVANSSLNSAWLGFTYEAPPAPPVISSSTHPSESTWYNDNTATVSWTEPFSYTGIAGYSYLLDRTATTTPPQTVTHSTTQRTASTPTLAEGVSYVHVRAKNNASQSAQWGSPDHFTLRVDTGVPSTPVISSASHPDETKCYADSTPSMSWTASSSMSGIKNYSWVRDTSSGTTPDAATGTTTTGRTATPTVPDGTSYFHVKALNNAVTLTDSSGTPSLVDHYKLRVDSTKPGLPSVSSSSHPDQNKAYSQTSVSMAWSASDPACGIAGYSYVFNQTSGTIPDTLPESTPSPATFTAVKGVDNYFHVRAVNGSGLWSDTTTYKLRIYDVAPPNPKNPRNGDVTTTTPTLEVEPVTPPPGSTGMTYLFQVSTSATSWTTPVVQSTWQTGTTFPIPTGKLTAGTKYHWRAAAKESGGGQSPFFSPPRSFTAADKPAAPTNVTAAQDPAASSPTFKVSWTAGSNGGAALTAHTVRAYDSAGVAKTVPLSDCGEGCTSGAVSGLTAGQSYTFSVTATNPVGDSPESVRSPAYQVHAAPTVSKTLAAGKDSVLPGVHQRGQSVEYTVTVTNPNSDTLTLDELYDVLPAGIQVGGLSLNGQPCLACRQGDGRIELRLPDAKEATATSPGTAGALDGGASATFTYAAVLAGNERDCVSGILNSATVKTVWGSGTGTASAIACAGGLGLEPWWSFWATEVGPQSSAAVNPANGNLVLTATDSTPVQGHGRLGYVLRRSYNSQEPTAASLPGSLGAGWALNLGHTDDLAGAGVTGTGLVVPRLGEAVAKLTDPLSVTLVDRDGTRHVFSPKPDLPAVPVGALSGELAALTPTVLKAPAGRTVCVDLGYRAPAGVHLGLWRYVAVDGGCDAITASSKPVVLGYAAVRPDRLRTEYAATGQLLSMVDGAGNDLRYAYEGSADGLLVDGVVLPGKRLALVYEPSAACTATADPSGNPSVAPTCRAFRLSYPDGAVAVTDPAGRTTTYRLAQVTVAGLPAPVQVLAEVVNPDVASPTGNVTYRYQGDPAASPLLTDCGGSPLQLCSVTDPRGATTSFSYTRDVGLLGGLGRVATVTERPRADGAAGTPTAFTYTGDRRSTTAVRGRPEQPDKQQRTWSGIDDHGRVATTLDGPVGDSAAAGYPATYRSLSVWDGTAADGTARDCVELVGGTARTGGRDNNLCEHVMKGSTNPTGATTPNPTIKTPDRRTTSTYDAYGMLLRTVQDHQVVTVTGTDPAGRPSFSEPAAGAPGSLITTYGHVRQHVASTGRTNTTYKITGGDGSVSGTREATAANELFTIADRTEMLPPRGNAAGAEWQSYLHEWTVDNTTGNPNSSPVEDLCASGAGTSNTGLVCAQTTPHRTGDGVNTTAKTSFSYDTFGQAKTRTTPKANAEFVPDSDPNTDDKPQAYRYLYYDDAQLDLSNGVSAGGWLKAVIDPHSSFVAFAHDRAGNVVRTWDRNATRGKGTAEAFDVRTADQYASTLYGAGPDALAKPWRSVRSSSDPLGNTTSQTVDANGYLTAVRPPRGNAAGDSSHDTTMTVNAWGQVLTVTTPAEPSTPAVHGYDEFGNKVRSTDPRGTVTTYRYDVVNRLIETTFVRGDYDPNTHPAAAPKCTQSSTGSPFGAGKLLCTTKTSYDSHGNPVLTTGPDGQLTHTGYDSLGRATVTVTSRRDFNDDQAPGATDFTPHVITETVYEATVPVRTCNPRQYDDRATEPGATSRCEPTSPHAVHTDHDVADRPMTTTTYRTPGTTASDGTTTPGEKITRSVGYDADGNPVRSRDARGTISRAEYDLLDRLVRSTSPRQSGVELTTGWHYDPVGNTLAVIRPGAEGDNVGLNGAGTDRRITGYSYDAANRLVDTVTALQVPVVDPLSHLAIPAIGDAVAGGRTDEAAQTNLRTRVGYDGDGNVTVRYNERAFAGPQTDPATPDPAFALRTTFDRNGRPSTQYAPRYNEGVNDPTATTRQPANAQQKGECPTGAPLYPAGVGVCVTTLGYDPSGNITTVTLPDEAADTTPRRLSYTYTADNLVAAVTAPDPAADGGTVTVATYTHDGSGRTLSATNAAGRTSTTGYTADGLASVSQGPAGPGGLAPRTETVHNAAGQSVKTLTHRRTYSPDTSDPTGEQTLVSTTSYSPDGLVLEVTTGGVLGAPANDPRVLRTRYGYDLNGNPTEVFSPNAMAKDSPDTANPAGAPTRYGYTLDNLLATTEQPVTVNDLGVLTSRTTTYGYDSAGRKTTVDVDTTAAPGDAQSFSYYPSDALKTTSGRAGNGGGTIRRGYDATGLPTLVEQTLGSQSTTVRSSFYLDGLLRSTDSTASTGGGATTRTAFAYDGVGGPAARADGPADTFGDAAAVATFTTGDAALPTAMTDPAMTNPATGSGQTSWAYNSLGQTTREVMPSGQTQTFAYGSDDTLTATKISTSAALADAGTADLASYSYRYDELGRVLAQEHYGTGAGGTAVGSPSAPVTHRFTYDSAGRLETFRDARGLRNLSYDPNGNRLAYGTAGQVDPVSFTYRADDSIATRTGTSGVPRTYSYDAYGSLSGDGCLNYGYDGMDRLKATSPDPTAPTGLTGTDACPTGSTGYRYDGLDRQISKTYTAGPLAQSATSTFAYDGLGSRVWQRTDSGASSATVDYALDPNGRAKAVTQSGQAPTYLAGDGQGSTALLTSPDKTVTCATRYDAYGSPDTNDGAATAPPATPCASGDPGLVDLFYRGERRDAGTGNYQLGARTYDPTKAAFLTPDVYRDDQPNANLGLGVDPLTRNTYAYVNGDPVNYTDPSGHEPRKWHRPDYRFSQEVRQETGPRSPRGVEARAKASRRSAGQSAYSEGGHRVSRQFAADRREQARVFFDKTAPGHEEMIFGQHDPCQSVANFGAGAYACGSALMVLDKGGSAEAAIAAYKEAFAGNMLASDMTEAAIAAAVGVRLEVGRSSTAIRTRYEGSAPIPSFAKNRTPAAEGAVDVAASRVKLRIGTKSEVRENAPKTADGDFIDPNTGQVIPQAGPFQYGHRPGFEWWRTQQRARKEGWTRRELIEYENNPNHFQIEDPSSNMSHRFEMPR